MVGSALGLRDTHARPIFPPLLRKTEPLPPELGSQAAEEWGRGPRQVERGCLGPSSACLPATLGPLSGGPRSSRAPLGQKCCHPQAPGSPAHSPRSPAQLREGGLKPTFQMGKPRPRRHTHLLEAPQPDTGLGGVSGGGLGPSAHLLDVKGPHLGKELVWGSPKLPRGAWPSPCSPPHCAAEILPLGQRRFQASSEPQPTPRCPARGSDP